MTMKKKPSRGGIVYSTEHGRMCPACHKPACGCLCRAASTAYKNDGIIRVSRRTKGVKGKGLTVITGIPLAGPKLEALAKQLKQKCGAGGTVREGSIEIQGDHRDMLAEELGKMGYVVKKAGG